MDDNSIDIVRNHFARDQFIQEMLDRNALGLRDWERIVVDRYFGKKGRVLDIGCGTGREAFALAKRGYQVVGIDISHKEIEIARDEAKKLAIDASFKECDGLTLDFGDAAFDYSIIWAQTFGNFYSRENQLLILAENSRVLMDGGILCFSAHDHEFVKANYGQFTKEDRFYPYADSDCYWKLFTVGGLAEMAAGSGFDVLFCGKSRELGKDVELDVLVCVCSKGQGQSG
jgi:ubiquinone/menaquinone biosynthesis C-methylase UbiE